MTPSEALAISQDLVDYLRDINGNMTSVVTELDLEAFFETKVAYAYILKYSKGYEGTKI